MKHHASALLLAASSLVSSLLAGCTTPAVDDELGQETAADGEDSKSDASGLFTYFTVVPDQRQCSLNAGPDCGVGFFAARANRSQTPCGGAYQPACKITAIDWTHTSISAISAQAYEKELREGSQFVLRGTIVASADGKGLTLEATELYTSSSSDWADAETGVFTMVQGNGLACIESPCADKTERKLNSNLAGVNIAWIDFKPIDETADWIDGTEEAIADYGAIVVGYRFEAEGAKGRTANVVFNRAFD
jgi:hypothetical protein